MPRQREPADVFYATDEPTPAPATPAAPKTVPTKPTSPPQAPTPPGPINLELRTGMAGDQTRIALTQRIYDYEIQQTDDTLTITGYLKPKADT